MKKSDRQGKEKEKNLIQRSFNSLFWILSSTGLRIIIQFLQTIILARLLSPTDFGLIGAALIVVRFVEMSPLGVGPALIQMPQLEAKHLRTGFTISLLFGLFLGVIVWLGAPLFAAFFKNEQLILILRVIAFSFPVGNISVVAAALLERELKYRWLSSLQLLAYTLGYGVVGITLAFLNFGVWSLVSAYLVKTILETLFLLIAQPHPKALLLEKEATKELTSLGGGFTLNGFFTYLALQGDYIVVGRVMGAAALGLYTRAYHLMSLPTNTIGQAINRILFAAFGKVQNEPERLGKAYRRNILITALIAMPLSLTIYVLAPEIILVLLGQKWREVIVPFKILAFGTFFRLAHKVSGALARSSGQVYKVAWIQLLYAALVVIGTYLGTFLGLQGVAIGVTLALITQYLLLTRFGVKMTGISWQAVIGSHLRALPLSLATSVSAWLTATSLRGITSAFWVLTIASGISIVTAVSCVYLAPKVFLGEDGQWWLQTINKYLSKLPFLKKLKMKQKRL